MFLSRIQMNPQCYNSRKAIGSPQILHASVENCFSSGESKERKLWRLDTLNDRLFLLLLCHTRPDFSHFSEQFCQGAVGETKDYDALLERIQIGQKWNFRLRGNTTHNAKVAENTRGKVYAHVTIEQKREWLIKKALHCGFTLEEGLFDVVETEMLNFRRNSAKSPVTIGVSVFEGVLEITDEIHFRQALVQGIGRAKAYGCGLLTIAKQI